MSPDPHKTFFRNGLLRALGADDLGLLRPHLSPVSLSLRDVIEAPNRPIDDVIFIESGMGSILAVRDSDQRIEVGMFGREGMSGIPVIMGGDRSAQQCIVQIAGEGLRIGSDHLRQAMSASPSLQRVLLHFVQSIITQTAHTAFANRHGKLEARLARWLLMAHDRVEGDEIQLIHEFLALMLGVRRAGVTEALHVLEGRGAVRTTRGRIAVADRQRLEESAAGLYGVPEAEYRRLIGWNQSATPAGPLRAAGRAGVANRGSGSARAARSASD